MRINVIRVGCRDEVGERISDRVFVIEGDTLEAIAAGIDFLNQIDPLEEIETQNRGDGE